MGLRDLLLGTLSNTFGIGNQTAGDKTLFAETGAATPPFIKWVNSAVKWSLSNDGSAVSPIVTESAIKGAIVQFGNGSLTETTTTRYLTPGYDAGVAQVTEWFMSAPFTGTIKNLHIRHNEAGGSANTIVYTVRVEAADSTVTATLAANGSTVADTSHTAAVTQGNRISVKATKASGVTTSPGNVIVTFEVVA